MLGQLQSKLQAKLRDAVSCKNEGNDAVSPLRGAPTTEDWERAAMAYLRGLHVLEDFAKNAFVILGCVSINIKLHPIVPRFSWGIPLIHCFQAPPKNSNNSDFNRSLQQCCVSLSEAW